MSKNQNNKQGIKAVVIILIFILSAILSIYVDKTVKDNWYAGLTETDYIWKSGTVKELKLELSRKKNTIEEKNYLVYLGEETNPFKTYNMMQMPENTDNIFSRLEVGNKAEIKVLKDQYNHEGHWGKNLLKTIYFNQPDDPVIIALKVNGKDIDQYDSDAALGILKDRNNLFVILLSVISIVIISLIITILINPKKNEIGNKRT